MAATRHLPLALLLLATSFARASDYEREPIHYGKAAAENIVTRLQARLDANVVQLDFNDKAGYLRAALRALDVPESSQVLVFSKTSLQRERIAPKTPRAIYFNDDVYVGFCQGGPVMEVSAVDPRLGTVFYTLDQEPDAAPRFARQTDACLLCHGSTQTRGFPGHLVRSVYSDVGGFPILAAGSYRTDQTSPLEQRWGGWYVTGTSGGQRHLGNLIVRNKQTPEEIDNRAGVNVTDLAGRFDTSAYPTPHSDLVALMVLEHQAMAHNLLTRANFLTRVALWEEEDLNRALGRPKGYRSESTTSRIQDAGEPLVKYLLFSGEARLTGRLTGTTSFATEFVRRGPRDARGRSLRDLDLERRLFRHPCSYLIYSASFDALPGAVRDYVLKRVHEVLTGKDATAAFAHLSAEDRRAVLEILRETKANLPGYYRMGGKP